MKRHGSSDSMTGLIPMCHIDESISSPVAREFHHQSMLMMDEGDEEECGQRQMISEKKRRLSVDQVKALEKNFEMDNKLEPDRKVKLAQELGLQPRQVAVWFQNRRARWKTKQLETDFGLLQAKFHSLQQNYDTIKLDNQSLIQQITELKSKLYGGGDEESNIPVKKEESQDDKSKYLDNMVATTYFKDGSSDSDSSAILNEDNNNNMAAIAEGHQITGDDQNAYEPQFVKIEEHNFFGGDESCNFFSDDQAPTLQWYCQDQWNLTKQS